MPSASFVPAEPQPAASPRVRPLTSTRQESIYQAGGLPNLRARAMVTAGAILLAMSSLLMFTRAQASPRKPALTRLAAGTPAATGANVGSAAPGAPAELAAAPVVSPSGKSLIAYQGLGAWVSLYDYDETNAPIDPNVATSEMVARGVQTLYLQTTRWNLPNPFDAPQAAGALIDAAHARGIRVVGWYLPGFANDALDVRQSVGALQFVTPKGGRLDGLALDIEDKSNFGYNVAGFNAGVASFSRALRAAVGPNAVLGGIVPDAVNDLRSPASWAGFPWPEIAKNYDVVMPMAYWSVTKSSCSQEFDAAGYTTRVYNMTEQMMGTTKPMVVIGGIGDCNTLAEVQGYVQAIKATNELGAGIYSFETLQHNGGANPMWKALAATRR